GAVTSRALARDPAGSGRGAVSPAARLRERASLLRGDRARRSTRATAAALPRARRRDDRARVGRTDGPSRATHPVGHRRAGRRLPRVRLALAPLDGGRRVGAQPARVLPAPVLPARRGDRPRAFPGTPAAPPRR